MFFEWRPYVSVGQRLANATKHAAKQAKKSGREPAPVSTKLKKLAATFWGLAWCENLDRYSDYENRLPRGRTYLRNGSVVDLVIQPGAVQAVVAGSEVYNVSIKIKPLDAKVWKSLKTDCARSIHSLIDLLQGKFDQAVMQRLSQPKTGLFPEPKEISMTCSCPDSARVCKHLAAVIYGIGVRLDTAPELLFKLRQVDHGDLVTQALADGNLEQTLSAPTANSLAGSDLGEMFGIDLGSSATASKTPAPKKTRATRQPMAKVAIADTATRTAVKPPADKLKTASKAVPAKPAVKPKKAAAKSAKTTASKTKTAKKPAVREQTSVAKRRQPVR